MQSVRNNIQRLRMFIGGGTYAEMVAKNRQKFIDLFVKNIHKTIALIITIYGVYFYFRYVRNRVSKLLAIPYNKYMSTRTIGRVSQNNACVNTKLCDLYIASSARSYLPGNQKYDYASEKAIVNAIRIGARFLEIDVYNESFCPDTIPVVFNGKEEGNWQYTTKVTFDACCRAISKNAFNKLLITNYDDPLFLYLNLYLNGNMKTAGKVVTLLLKYFPNNLYIVNNDIDSEITDFKQKPLSTFIGKVVVFANSAEYLSASPKGSAYSLGQIVTKVPYNADNFDGDKDIIEYNSAKVDDIYDIDEAGDDHKVSLAFVFPEFQETVTQNYHPAFAFTVGCQFIAMNYQLTDNAMDFYINTIFKSSSFIKKPKKLLYKEEVIEYTAVMDDPDSKTIGAMVDPTG